MLRMISRILFVDDEPELLLLYAAIAGGKPNWEVFCAQGGAMALGMLETGQFNVIVSDMNMPGMSGVDVLQFARDQRPQMQRMMLTGLADSSQTKLCQQMGHTLLLKPCKPAKLLSAIEELCAASRRAAVEADLAAAW